ncbi:MAG TPA: hypothetical protein ENG11_02710 [candidate division Zixibacteria bacterium]|nr:hypothetical protein [candidate division Zixibacteria bacterium]
METGNYAFLLPANRLELPVFPPKKSGVTSYNTTNYNFTLSFTAFTSPLRAGGRFFVWAIAGKSKKRASPLRRLPSDENNPTKQQGG